MFFRIWKGFCEESTIHGFKYLTGKRLKYISKIFWAVAIVSSIACTLILIKSLIDEYARNLIVITRDSTTRQITEIPFPAFTLCFPVKTGIDEPFDDLFFDGKFDYRQHVGDYWSIEGSWMEKYLFDITFVVTKFGFCRAFNILLPDDFFNKSAVDEIFTRTQYYEIDSTYVVGSPIPEPWNETEPFKTAHKDLGVFISMPDTSKALGAQPLRQQFRLILHAPHEMASEFSQQFIISDLDILLFRVTLQLTEIDGSLIGLKPEEFVMTTVRVNFNFGKNLFHRRQCYLEGEKVLRMFKIYSFENCRSECLAEFISRRCDCIPFYMIRNSSASICKSSQISCYDDAQRDFLQLKEFDCHCFPPCTELKYNFEKEKTGLTEATTFHNLFEAVTSFSIRFKAGEFYPQVKRKQNTIVDLFAFVGGVLGLFLGMSVLSVVEVFYLLLVRPFTKASKPLPDETSSANQQATKYCLSYLNSSSIHSFNHIGDGNRNILERVTWIALLVLSLIGCTFMVGQLQGKVKINLITMIIEDKSHANSEIPFPAITFFGTYPKGNKMWYYSEDGEPKNTTRDEYIKDPNHLIQWIADSNVETTQASLHKKIWQEKRYGNTSQLKGYESQIVPGIHRRSKLDWFRCQNGTFCKHFGVPTAEILTSRGFGFAFNILDADELYREDQISNDFKYERHDDDLPNFSAQFPWFTSPGCADDGLNLNLKIKDVEKREKIVFYSEAFIIHPPDDLPLFMAREDAVEIDPGKFYEVLITPDVVTIDEDLKRLPYEDRSCYVEGEKQLRFFKAYTKHNCEVECLSNRSREVCGCAPFDVMRDAETQVCGVDKAICINEVKYQLKFSSSNDDMFESCQCLLPCDSVIYNYKVVESKLRKTRTNEALLTFKFKDSEYTPMKRVRQFTMIDFCSYVGGLLGLFAGFSVLSFCEIFYFFTLRLFSNMMLTKTRPTHKIIEVRPRAPQRAENSENENSSGEWESAQASSRLNEWTYEIHSRAGPIISQSALLRTRPGSEYFGPVIDLTCLQKQTSPAESHYATQLDYLA